MDMKLDLSLQEATTLILLCLADEPRYGYAILKEVEALSEGRVVFSTRTLYGALSRLLDQGLVTQQENINAQTGRVRKIYALTPLGREVLDAEAYRLAHLSQMARLRLAG